MDLRFKLNNAIYHIDDAICQLEGIYPSVGYISVALELDSACSMLYHILLFSQPRNFEISRIKSQLDDIILDLNGSVVDDKKRIVEELNEIKHTLSQFRLNQQTDN